MSSIHEVDSNLADNLGWHDSRLPVRTTLDNLQTGSSSCCLLSAGNFQFGDNSSICQVSSLDEKLILWGILNCCECNSTCRHGKCVLYRENKWRLIQITKISFFTCICQLCPWLLVFFIPMTGNIPHYKYMYKDGNITVDVHSDELFTSVRRQYQKGTKSRSSRNKLIHRWYKYVEVEGD